MNGKRPNIVLIMADDHGYADLGCSGLVDDVRTPNLDRLAEQGTRFLQAYATSPICNASRAGLMTGCDPARQGIFWYGGKGIHRQDLPTIAELLKKAGYANGYFGKFHYGGAKAHAVDSRSFPMNHGFKTFYGFGGGRKHYLIHSAEAEATFLLIQKEQVRPGPSLQQGAMWRNRRQVDQSGFSTELFGEQARVFIERNRENPFFVQLSFNAVHNFTHQLPEEYLKAHNLKGFYDWDAASEDYDEWYRRGRRPNNPEGRAYYLGQLHYLDLEVGRILNYLDQTGLREKTLVIYIGDNGGSTPIYANNGPLRGSKYTLYEGGIRVPLIISWPGNVQAGRLSGNVVSAMALLPTICAAAGIDIPKILDGQNILPHLSGKAASLQHETLVWDTGHETAVRQGKWKLRTAKSNEHAERQGVKLELGEFLYDLDTDPGETKNLAKEHPDVQARLKKLHAEWWATIQDR
ncbi:MAG: sulfatase-like hydrolase/transferase [Planctomycetes bacterium]|nr:sulfatase-like hydrolase/transferase [Planctomycetota bacterium]